MLCDSPSASGEPEAALAPALLRCRSPESAALRDDEPEDGDRRSASAPYSVTSEMPTGAAKRARRLMVRESPKRALMECGSWRF
jgi:hypothetical protein